MTALTTPGLFLYDLSLKPSMSFLTFSRMCACSLTPPSRQFSATTAASLITPRPTRSSSLMGSFFGCRAHTHPNRTDVLSAFFAQSTTLCGPCCFRPVSPRFIGLTLSILPPTCVSLALDGHSPFFALHGTQPSYAHLRVFDCACYPNLSSTAPHKLSPRSSLCVFLGYSSDHKGYRCLDLHSNRIIVSRHVVFDETLFLFSEMSTSPRIPTHYLFWTMLMIPLRLFGQEL
jgi:hypothetical protein